jgi:hypothetical protein
MYYNLINSMNRAVVSSYTARTISYATATGITDVTILGALNTWDLYAISKGLDSVYKQVFFLASGTSSNSVVNFYNPSTLLGTIFGGITFSSSGAMANGANGYINSNFNPSTQLASQNSGHFSFYSNLTPSNLFSTHGGYDGINRFHYYETGATIYNALNSNSLLSISPQFTKLGSFLTNRNNSSNFTVSKGSDVRTITNTSTSLVNSNLGIFGLLQGSTQIGSISDLRLTFWTTGNGMTAQQELDHHTGITNLMTTLGIQ